jgi:hypothetical protein
MCVCNNLPVSNLGKIMMNLSPKLMTVPPSKVNCIVNDFCRSVKNGSNMM